MSDYQPLKPQAIADAHARIQQHIHRTPLLTSQTLNEKLGGHEITFKVEGFQKIGAFKSRGALNTLLSLKEQDKLPQKVVAFSSGNHAQAVAWSSKLLGVDATICIPENSSAVKIQATRSYGANVILTSNRQEAEDKVSELQQKGAYLIHPYDNDMVIAGQGTSCYEALQDGVKPDAIFATCGGGGWLSGSFLAKQLLYPRAKIYAGEPLLGNDAATSYRTGKIHKIDSAQDTLADGARTLYVSERTFHYLQQIDGFFEITEEEIVYWTQWLMHLLKTTVEPTSAVAMAAAANWLKEQSQPQKVLVLLSGGNIAPETYAKVWEKTIVI